MKQFNVPLLLGILFAIPFLFVALLGPSLAPHDPAEIFKALNIDDVWYTSPFRPGEVPGFPLGTDDVGRDLLSRILWAVRPTLILALWVMTARLAIGFLLGLLAGWFQDTVGRLVDYLVSVSVSIPTLVFAVGLILLLGIDDGLVNFVVAMSLTGWTETAVLVKSQTLSIKQEPYIEGAHAIGLNSSGILWRYILPQFWPILPSLIAFELAAVMLLTAELGFLGVFLGGGTVIATPDPNSLGTLLSLSDDLPEIGQMLADFWGKIILAPWTPLYVGILVFAQIFAFNLLGEGLRRYMDVTRAQNL
ncbi:MAG: ABC transporter permease [Chloroflexota bacterium]